MINKRTFCRQKYPGVLILSLQLFRYVSSTYWAAPGSFSKTLAKGVLCTSWIWALHANAHDFDTHSGTPTTAARKVFSVNLAHVSLVLTWLSGMHMHGALFGNYSAWVLDPLHVAPSCHVVWDLVNQDTVNADVGGFHTGLLISSGLFQLWLSAGITSPLALKNISLFTVLLAGLILVAAYLHLKYLPFMSPSGNSTTSTLAFHHLGVLLGMGSLLWCGHLVHIAIPTSYLLLSGVAPSCIPSPWFLMLSLDPVKASYLSGSTPDGFLYTPSLFDPSSASISLPIIAAHHFFLGITLFLAAGAFFLVSSSTRDYLSSINLLGHTSLAIALAITGSLSITFSQHLYLMNPYAFLSTDYLSMIGIYTHHMWIGGFLLVGSF